MCPLCGRSFIFIWHRCLCILLLERLLKNYCNQVNMMFIHNMTCKMPFYNQNIQCVSFMSLFIILDASKACVKIGKFWDRRSLIFVLLPWIFRKKLPHFFHIPVNGIDCFHFIWHNTFENSVFLTCAGIDNYKNL